MNQHVVVGLDGSAESVAASHWAAREALLRDTDLHLVHVEERLPAPGVPTAGSDLRRTWVRDLFHGVSEELLGEHPRLRISSEALDGRPTDALAGVAANASMLVLGSRGLGTVSGFVLGSVGLAVVHAVRQPVVLVRAPEDVPPGAGSGDAGRGVVVGVDLGRPCDALLAFAFEEASRRHRTLTALHSWMLPPLAGTGAAYSAEVNALIARSTETDLEHLLSPWRDRYPSVVLDARAAVGHPSRQLLEACAGAELVVVGRRIRRARIGGHVGPVTHAVLHHSTAPVAVVAHS